ncbi:DUF2326 domain-containing protein [Lactobacillus salivarius]|uniref:DUF2326 domain-containing protein n=1 Tax=Ligilactobacillus salivarius TaxID=1624 RepID=A0A6N9IUH0_9LACO|nr:DUF2326 domain-containing protein [Ligilactobacillus salivarius]
MLKEISCDQFIENGKVRGPIVFNKGLNVVLGGHSGTNSIGKSTFLMIIDFVFGGDDYVKKDYDVQKNVGQHVINFAFEFDGKDYYFSRSTEDFQYVNVCDEEFNPIEDKILSTDEYRDFLSKQYKLDLPKLSFRNAVGRFIRVYNRETTDEKHPLQNATKESEKQQVYSLLKLFDHYSSIEKREAAEKEASYKFKTFKNAAGYKYVPVVETQKQFKDNLKKIDKLKQELVELESQNNDGTFNIDDFEAERLRKIRSNLSQLREQRNVYRNRLNTIKINEEAGSGKNRSNYRELKKFFPSVNINKIEQIDHFHHQITKILKKEFEQETNTINDIIEMLSKQIYVLVDEARKIKNQQAPNVQTALLNEYADKKAELKKLEDENRNFEKKKELEQAKKDQQEALMATVNTEIAEVQRLINNKMEDLNEEVCESSSFQPPIIQLGPKGYTFETINDQGTGTSYKGLILFDQACLELTALPFVVHDSLLFPNIELERRNKIIEMYGKATKQIFISIDTIEILSDQAQKVISDHTVLELERGGRELFGRSWNEQNAE